MRLAHLREVYTTLTGLPIRPRIAGPEGSAIVKQIRERLSIVSLTEEECVSTLETASASIVGNTAYDALIARCAIKVGAAGRLTWNVWHLTRLGPAISPIVKTPADL
jgi:hypothetical protein